MLRYPRTTKHAGFCIFILPLKAVNHSSMICDLIHAFLLDLNSTGSLRMSRFRKHHGFAALPITKGFSISRDIKPHRKTVSLSLHSFPPEQFSPVRRRFIRKRVEDQSSLITVRYVFRFISLDYGWQFSYPLLNSLTVYVT